MRWHGYDQEENSHPVRPWWRFNAATSSFGMRGKLSEFGRMVRKDGRQGPECFWSRYRGPSRAEMLEAITGHLVNIDKGSPLPDPKPLALQVWLWPASGCTRVVLAIEPNGAVVFSSLGPVGPLLNAHGQAVFPPRPAVLVAGPGSPWAPGPRD